MKKDAKLGISVALFSMLAFFLGYYSIVACALLFVVALAFAENKELKINATEAMVFAAIINITTMLLDTVSSKFFGFLWYIAGFFTKAYDFYNGFSGVINFMQSKLNIVTFASNLIELIAFILMIVFVFKALNGGVVKVPFATKLVEKHFNDAE